MFLFSGGFIINKISVLKCVVVQCFFYVQLYDFLFAFSCLRGVFLFVQSQFIQYVVRFIFKIGFGVVFFFGFVVFFLDDFFREGVLERLDSVMGSVVLFGGGLGFDVFEFWRGKSIFRVLWCRSLVCFVYILGRSKFACQEVVRVGFRYVLEFRKDYEQFVSRCVFDKRWCFYLEVEGLGVIVGFMESRSLVYVFKCFVLR